MDPFLATVGRPRQARMIMPQDGSASGATLEPQLAVSAEVQTPFHAESVITLEDQIEDNEAAREATADARRYDIAFRHLSDRYVPFRPRWLCLNSC